MRKINKIIVHCSATKEGRGFSALDIKKWHTDTPPRGNGWDDIGYHYVIKIDGTIEQGRPIEKVGAHTAGHNTNSIGLCYVGGLDKDMLTPKDTRTLEQKISLITLVKELQERFNIPNSEVYGHNDFNKGKACPCFNIKQEFNNND